MSSGKIRRPLGVAEIAILTNEEKALLFGARQAQRESAEAEVEARTNLWKNDDDEAMLAYQSAVKSADEKEERLWAIEAQLQRAYAERKHAR